MATAEINMKKRKLSDGQVVAPCFAPGRNASRDRLKKKFDECLHALRNNENAYNLLAREVYIVESFLRRSDAKIREDSPPTRSRVRKRNDVSKLGVPAACLRASLRALFAILQIDDSRPDCLSIRTEQALLDEAREAFLRNFVNCLEFDEDNNVEGSHGSSLMHWLVELNEVTMLRLLLDRNVNMIQRDKKGRTPLSVACGTLNEEIVAMFMYYNVSPNVPSLDEEPVKYIPLCTAASNDNIVGMLIEYAYDKWSDLDFDVLWALMVNKSRHFERFVEIQRENFSSNSSILCHDSSYSFFWDSFYTIPSSYLKEMLVFFTKNKKAFDDLTANFNHEKHWSKYWFDFGFRRRARSNFLENLYVLASISYVGGDADGPKPTVLQAIMNNIYDHNPLEIFTRNCGPQNILFNLGIPLGEVESIILVLLTNGAPMDDYTMEFLFEYFDDLKLFNFGRSLPVNIMYRSPSKGYHASSFFHNFPEGKTMWQVVSDPANEETIHLSIDFFTSMSSHPNVKKMAYKEEFSDFPEYIDYNMIAALLAKVQAQPQFPTLLEVARDAARNYVVEKYRVQKSWQFYEAVKTLKIPEKLKKIIAYDTPLYSRINRDSYTLPQPGMIVTFRLGDPMDVDP